MRFVKNVTYIYLAICVPKFRSLQKFGTVQMFCSPFLNEDSNLFDSPLSQGLFGMCLNIDFFRGPDPYHQRVLQNLSKKKKRFQRSFFFSTKIWHLSPWKVSS